MHRGGRTQSQRERFKIFLIREGHWHNDNSGLVIFALGSENY